jgi:hypothetical protein
VRLKLGATFEKVWPFTGTDVSGTPSDPVNLIFIGDADPRQIRQALMSLDGDRTAHGLPAVFPFDCTWSDAIGRHQTAWASADGWQGSAIQMECGEYGSLRFHLRLFREGRRTLANVHFEVLIPGTVEHEVLGWEFAEGFVKLDMLRSVGLSAPPADTPPINPAPSYRTIRTLVFNGLPVSLRAALGLPTSNQTEPVPIPSNGQATILALSAPSEPADADTRLEYDQPFDQVVPKPFCSTGPLDYLKVKGPIRFVHRVTTNAEGRYEASFTAAAALDVVPIDPLTGLPTGPAFQAVITERNRSSISDRSAQAEHVLHQNLLGEAAQSFFENLAAGRLDRFVHEEECGPPNP